METLLKNLKGLDKQVAELSRQIAGSDLDGLLKRAVKIDDITLIAAVITLDSPKTLREVGDRVRDSLGSGIAVLGGSINEKAALLAIVTDDLTKKIKAGDIVNHVAKLVGGKGGGRPDMAQAGGPMVDKLNEAIRSVPSVITALLHQP
ncbi:MAG: hypothetical protein ACD_75C02448G0003 [uncultured bacterium]|nr:MAG: hypothetical protein ACD_75C02448G0003 [uncultured bacterium]